MFQLTLVCAAIQLIASIMSSLVVNKLSVLKIRQSEKSEKMPALSIIIAAQNEAENLSKNIPEILKQNYTDFELIVINDRSIDETEEVLISLEKRHSNFRFFNANPNDQFPGKKNALKTGIDNATSDYLVFTDADCIPASLDWLRHFGKSFNKGNQLVIGFGLFQKEDNLINWLYRLDSIRIAIRYLTAAVLFRPYMAVGRSFGYTKTLFHEVNGFSTHEKIKSGDDDLFIQSIPLETKHDVVLEALTISQTPKTLNEWITQKKRHLEAGKSYSVKSLILLTIIDLSDFVSVFGLAYFLVNGNYFLLPILVLMVILRYLVHAVSVHNMQRVMCYESVPIKEIFLDAFMSLLNPLFSVASQLRHSKEWNRKK